MLFQFIDLFTYSLKWSLLAYLKSTIPKFKHVEALKEASWSMLSFLVA